MDETKLSQLVDFLDIAVEQMEKENDDVAQDFVEEVYAVLEDELDER